MVQEVTLLAMRTNTTPHSPMIAVVAVRNNGAWSCAVWFNRSRLNTAMPTTIRQKDESQANNMANILAEMGA